MDHYLITSGGTKVPIDEVRHVGNMSSGKFGAEIAQEALRDGHRVTFLCAKGSVRPDRVTLNIGDPDMPRDIGKVLWDTSYIAACRDRLAVVEYHDFADYAEKLQHILRQTKPAVTVLTAAVSDYGMPPTGGKISSDKDEITFTMTRLPKLISQIKIWCPSTYLVGFKLLVDATPEKMADAAAKQIATARSDLVVANDLREIKQGKHVLYLFRPNGKNVDVRVNLARNLIRILDDRDGDNQ